MPYTAAQLRERGLRRLEVWLPLAVIDALDRFGERMGMNRTQALIALVQGAEERELKGKKR